MHGSIASQEGKLVGVIRLSLSLVGKVSIPTGYKYYKGNYTVKPKVNTQILETKDKLVAEDIKVESIPYYEVSNLQGGTTIIIGGE